MNVLVVGKGGREHAIAWRIAQSPKVRQVFVAPGNAGTALEPNIENISIASTDIESLLSFAQKANIRLTVVGPEAPLCEGIVDSFEQSGLACLGPTQKTACLESSKAFSKAFMQRYGIPTASSVVLSDFESAKVYIEKQSLPIVIKADGLAAGKGVVIAHTTEVAVTAARHMLLDGTLGEAGHQILIEDYLEGEELSFMVLTDGKTVLPLSTSQDHKARDNGDQGPNTGGMGAYSPVTFVTSKQIDSILNTIIYPTIDGMRHEGTPYVGFLYAGLMVTPSGEIKVLEFNCRLGDPETQPLMLRLQSDLFTLCEAAIQGQLDSVGSVCWDSRPALGVVLAAKGYPGAYDNNQVIKHTLVSGAHHFSSKSTADSTHSADPKNVTQKMFFAGVTQQSGQLLTHGGRVMCATALGDSLIDAQRSAYQLANTVQWPAMYYRTDIGYRAIARELSCQS